MCEEVIAGHTFVDGRCVRAKPNGEECGRRWADIQYFGHDNIDEKDIAHDGVLHGFEAEQIVRKKAKQDDAVNNAFGWKKKDAASDAGTTGS